MLPAKRDETILVVGAGLMGTGIAHAFACAHRAVVLLDTSPAALEQAISSIRCICVEGVSRRKLTSNEAERVLERICLRTDLASAIKEFEVDLLIETAAESFAIKQEIIAVADPLLPERAVIATNTSALSVTGIAAACKRVDRVVGMHFFNPVHKMKLVEIVRALGTSDETVGRARRWSESIGKTAIVVNESPGLTTSRMSALLGNEAMYMLMEGTASAEDIDTALRLGFNHPMGPLELGDLTGWDTRLAVLQYLHDALGEKFRPCPLIGKLVMSGRLGRKAGRGIYEYVDGRRVPGSGLKTHG
jgi:3-hydroxybutyryl-CoA dehydrogenase